MPGSVVAAAAAETMPHSLCAAFEEQRTWRVEENTYALGESQRRAIPATSRRRWALKKRLTTELLDALREFYYDRKGPVEAFFFYSGLATTPPWEYDETGSNTVGRFTVRFENETWVQAAGLPRHETEVVLIEVS